MASGLKPQTDATNTTASVAPSQIEVSISNQTTETASSTAASSSPVMEEDEDPLPSNNVQAEVNEYFKDIPVMQDIAYCESRDRQFDEQGSVFRGKVNHDDVGVMQINTDYHLDKAEAMGIDIFTTEGNMTYARELFEKEGTEPWDSSSKCWIPRSNLVAMK